MVSLDTASLKMIGENDFGVAGPGAGSTGSVYLWQGAESP